MRSLASSRGDAPPREDEYVTVESGPHFCFHYVLSGGVCILTLTERAYPKRLAFDYLDELRKEFFQIYGSQVATATRPYEFIRFDTFIQKTKKVYNDSKTQRNLQKLNSELKDVHSIMTKNINEVISRGERLDSMFPSVFDTFFCEREGCGRPCGARQEEGSTDRCISMFAFLFVSPQMWRKSRRDWHKNQSDTPHKPSMQTACASSGSTPL